MQPKSLVAGIVAGIAIAAGIWVATTTTSDDVDTVRAATLLPVKTPLPGFVLTTHEGANATETAFEGQWDLVFFGFTNCPDVCPLTLRVLATARAELAQKGFEPLPRIVLVSVDPERDTPPRLARYIASFGEDNLGLTGERAELRKLTDGVGIFFEKRESEDEHYQVDHSSVVLVIDSEGRFHALFSSPHRVDDYVHDLPLVIGS